MNIKIKFTVLLTAVMGVFLAKSQIFTGATPSFSLGNTNYFLDASKFEEEANSIGKLLGFPRADLTDFEFDLTPQDDLIVTDTYFDGVVVYNTATGKTKSGHGAQVDVKPGFYFFNNPTGTSLATGKWMPMGSAETIIDSTVREANIKLDTKDVYSIKATFTQNPAGNETTYTIGLPAGTGAQIGNIYKASVYNSDTNTHSETVYSVKKGSGDNIELVTGAPYMAAVYPAGTYNVVLYFTKP